ncbi:MAG: hypothetical protein IKL88_06815 [Erysipelotrichales bacterium]|nr:hypothetical protein [Erysipelotrichales bacterium]
MYPYNTPNAMYPYRANMYMPYSANSMNAISPYMRSARVSKPITRAFANFNYYNFLEGTQKTLTTINQIIPIVNQVSPMIRNATTLFKVANVINTMPQDILTQAASPSSEILSSVTKKTIENPTLFR